jgi:uncharacterized protein YbjT (DUF2867 family)
MKALIFGATGMAGQSVLRECLRDPDIELAASIGRSTFAAENPSPGDQRFRRIVHRDLQDLSSIEPELTGFDACFYTLGVSAGGMKEPDYEHITYGFTLAAAQALSRLNPGMTFIYISGARTDSSGEGCVMWTRVKGRTENSLLLPLAAYMFRPGIIQPVDGIKSKTPDYRFLYILMKPLLPLLRGAFPNQVVTTREIGMGMLAVAKRGYPRRTLETKDIRTAVGG